MTCPISGLAELDRDTQGSHQQCKLVRLTQAQRLRKGLNLFKLLLDPELPCPNCILKAQAKIMLSKSARMLAGVRHLGLDSKRKSGSAE